MNKINLIQIFLIIFFHFHVFAGNCEITIERTACKGKEVETLKPYGGKNPTVETKNTKDEAECKSLAEKSSKIIRKNTLAGKKVIAKYNEKIIGSYVDKGNCK